MEVHSRSKRVAVNATLLSLQHVVVTVVSIFAVGYIARSLGQNNYGVFSLAFTFPLIYMAVGTMGLRPLTMREISAKKEAAFDFIGRVVPVRLIFLFIALLAVITSAWFLYDDRTVFAAICIGGVALMLEHVSRIIQDVFQAFEEVGKIAARNIAVKIVSSLGSVAALMMGHGLFAVCLVYLLSVILGLAMNIALFRKRFKWPSLHLDWDFAKVNLRRGFGFLGAGVAGIVYTKIDIIMLSKMTTNEQVGEYSAAIVLFYQINFIADAIATSAFPAIASLFHTDREEAARVFRSGLTLILVASLPLAVGGSILSEGIIQTIYGEGYSASAPLFAVACVGLPLLFLSTWLSFSMGAMGKQRYVMMIAFLACATNVTLNAVLIPDHGAMGAAYAAVATQSLMCIGLSLQVFKEFPIRVMRGFALAIPVALLGMAVVAKSLADSGLILAILSGAVAYALLLIAASRNGKALIQMARSLKRKA